MKIDKYIIIAIIFAIILPVQAQIDKTLKTQDGFSYYYLRGIKNGVYKCGIQDEYGNDIIPLRECASIKYKNGGFILSFKGEPYNDEALNRKGDIIIPRSKNYGIVARSYRPDSNFSGSKKSWYYIYRKENGVSKYGACDTHGNEVVPLQSINKSSLDIMYDDIDGFWYKTPNGQKIRFNVYLDESNYSFNTYSAHPEYGNASSSVTKKSQKNNSAYEDDDFFALICLAAMNASPKNKSDFKVIEKKPILNSCKDLQGFYLKWKRGENQKLEILDWWVEIDGNKTFKLDDSKYILFNPTEKEMTILSGKNTVEYIFDLQDMTINSYRIKFKANSIANFNCTIEVNNITSYQIELYIDNRAYYYIIKYN